MDPIVQALMQSQMMSGGRPQQAPTSGIGKVWNPGSGQPSPSGPTSGQGQNIGDIPKPYVPGLSYQEMVAKVMQQLAEQFQQQQQAQGQSANLVVK